MSSRAQEMYMFHYKITIRVDKIFNNSCCIPTEITRRRNQSNAGLIYRRQ
jgi:hypothetical protein